jgi:hypothetical protein
VPRAPAAIIGTSAGRIGISLPRFERPSS